MDSVPASAATVFLALIACTAHATQPARTTFGKGYSAIFPGPPSCEATVQEAPGIRIPGERCSYFDEELGQGLTAEYMTFPDRIPSRAVAEQVLLASAKGAASSSDSHLVKQFSHQIGEYPALDVTFYPNKKGFVAFARYVLIGSDLIVVTVDGFKTTVAPESVSAFFESLTTR